MPEKLNNNNQDILIYIISIQISFVIKNRNIINANDKNANYK